MFPDRSLSVRNRLTLTDDWVWAQRPDEQREDRGDDEQRDVGRSALARSSVSRIQLTRRHVRLPSRWVSRMG